jgi:uncharacterized protein YjbI with pentapeptide repeats
MKTLTQDELNEILEEHSTWVASNGKVGKQANFENFDLAGLIFTKKCLVKVIFKNADCRGQNFEGLDLTSSDFEGANVEFASFKRSKLLHVNFKNAKLWGAKFDDADIWHACLLEIGS